MTRCPLTYHSDKISDPVSLSPDADRVHRKGRRSISRSCCYVRIAGNDLEVLEITTCPWASAKCILHSASPELNPHYVHGPVSAAGRWGEMQLVGVELERNNSFTELWLNYLIAYIFQKHMIMWTPLSELWEGPVLRRDLNTYASLNTWCV